MEREEEIKLREKIHKDIANVAKKYKIRNIAFTGELGTEEGKDYLYVGCLTDKFYSVSGGRKKTLGERRLLNITKLDIT